MEFAIDMSEQIQASQGFPAKHSFSTTYGAGENPPGSQAAEPGLLQISPSFAGKALKALKNEANRRKRQQRKRWRRWYQTKKAKQEAARQPVHPTLERREALAVEEAILAG